MQIVAGRRKRLFGVTSNYTKVPNKILDAIGSAPLSQIQHQIISVVLRFTVGYDRDWHPFTLSFLASKTGVLPSHLSRSLNTLIEWNVICALDDRKRSRVLRVVFICEDWRIPGWPNLPNAEEDVPESATTSSRFGNNPPSSLKTSPKDNVERKNHVGSNRSRWQERLIDEFGLKIFLEVERNSEGREISYPPSYFRTGCQRLYIAAQHEQAEQEERDEKQAYIDGAKNPELASVLSLVLKNARLKPGDPLEH